MLRTNIAGCTAAQARSVLKAGHQLRVAVHMQIIAVATHPCSEALKPLRAFWASLTALSSSSCLSSLLEVRAASAPCISNWTALGVPDCLRAFIHTSMPLSVVCPDAIRMDASCWQQHFSKLVNDWTEFRQVCYTDASLQVPLLSSMVAYYSTHHFSQA